MKYIRKGILLVCAFVLLLCPVTAFSEEMTPIEVVWGMEEVIDYFYYYDVEPADIYAGGLARVRAEHGEAVEQILNEAIVASGQAESVEAYLAREDMDAETLYLDVFGSLLEADPSLLDSILHGLFDNLDDYSCYFNEEEMAKFSENISGDFVGVGVGIIQDGSYLTVTRVLRDSPAEAAGLETGDRLYKIDNVSAVGMDNEIAVSYLRGEEGTTVHVEVLRDGSFQPLSFELTRAPIETTSVDYEIYDDYGYISIGDFNSHTAQYLGEAMDAMNEKGINRLIIDLRNNPGGIMSEASKALGYFLPRNAQAGLLRYSDGTEEPLLVEGDGPKDQYKIAVLINENSASAAEYFSGALKEFNAAVLIGQNSFGKGCAQQIFPLATGGGAKITISDFFTPNDHTIQGVGIAPVFAVENATMPIGTESFMPFDLSETVKVGESHPNVAALKERMRILGFHLADVSDVYDEATAKDVAFVQKALRMEVQDGTLNQATMEQFDKTAGNIPVLVDKQLELAISYVSAKESVTVPAVEE